MKRSVREVYLSGQISFDSLKELRGQILNLLNEEERKPITLYISSGGGSYYGALGFFEFMRMKRVKLITVAHGYVESAAFFLFLLGEKRKATSNSSFLLHPSTMTFEKVEFTQEKFEDEIASIQFYEETVCREFSQRTGISFKKVCRMKRRHARFSAAKALKIGLVTEVV